ncbi:MAG: glucosamine-6-phosphate isomerase [Planctomycetota bacterium]|jgi:glucosamine-6-phosphate deaminase|nr:glucosamine-6-phosphate isomerase [Planctomycetota bacterium]
MAPRRNESRVAPGWWDYTTLDKKILNAAAKLTEKDLPKLSRKGFQVRIHDTVQEFYNAEALEYIEAWMQATPKRPAGICGPVGPVEQLPLVAQIVNSIGLDLKHAHFWGMDEWVKNGKTVGKDFPLGFFKADWDLCFSRIDPKLRMPMANLHFPDMDVKRYVDSWNSARCVIMQGGQGEVKHWAFNDPPRREGDYVDQPPPPEAYRKLGARMLDLHPLTMIQNARTSGGGRVQDVPHQAMTVGPRETWKAECVSIWHPGFHDNPLGIRLTAYMISKRIMDTSVPMSLLADHPNVRFNYLRPGIGSCAVDIH